jgi:hypothetical protein
MIYPAKHLVRLFLRTFKYGGITLPPFGIFILAERLDEPALRAHELVHWEQYKRMGAVKFYATYLWYNVKYGYHNNPMEVEARQRQFLGEPS